MKIFVLTCYYVNVDSGEESNEIIGVYGDYAKALDRMFEEIKATRKDYENYDSEEETFDDGWEIWEKGEYFSNHCTIVIHTKEII